MATAVEKYKGRPLDNGSSEIGWIVRDTTDELEARSTVALATPPTYDGKVLDHIKVDPEANELYFCIAVYQNPAGATLDEASFSFDTGGGTQHITQSKATVDEDGDGVYETNIPDFGGAIGVSGAGINSTVEGCDIVVPVYNFSETHILESGDVDNTYKGILFRLTGTVCNASFKGCEAGECLFLGASGSRRANGKWEITYRFAASPNKTGLVIGSMTVDKKGWEYLWVYYEDVVDEAANILVKKPIVVKVEEVYDPGDFSTLDIGT